VVHVGKVRRDAFVTPIRPAAVVNIVTESVAVTLAAKLTSFGIHKAETVGVFTVKQVITFAIFAVAEIHVFAREFYDKLFEFRFRFLQIVVGIELERFDLFSVFFSAVRLIENIEFLLPQADTSKTVFTSFKIKSEKTIAAVFGILHEGAIVERLGIGAFIHKFGFLDIRTIANATVVRTIDVGIERVLGIPGANYEIAVFQV
jgi:hypothetical protein